MCLFYVEFEQLVFPNFIISNWKFRNNTFLFLLENKEKGENENEK